MARCLLAFVFGVAVLGLTGCKESKSETKAVMPVPMVTVAPPVERTVTNYEYATGRAEPLEQVELRARVNGYLKSLHFEPGSNVTKGQLLFEIDPDPYKTDLLRAKASLATADAELSTAEADLVRADTRLVTTKKEYDREESAFKSGAGSASARDKAKGDFDEAAANVRTGQAKILVAKARIEEAKAAIQAAELNLSYCTIKSPLTGAIGDRLVTEGNLIAGGQGNTTLLTTVVAEDKMDIAFDVDENTLERLQQAVRDGKIKESKPGEIPVEAGLALHGKGYPLKGYINFSDNRIDTKTGTIKIKARFDNPKPTSGERVLAAGMYARVRVPIGEPIKAMLVPDTAFGSDQGIKYLYLVGPENKAVRMDVVTGALEGDLRVVESVDVPGAGKPRPLTTGDRVIVTGLQRIRGGMTVDPKPAK